MPVNRACAVPILSNTMQVQHALGRKLATHFLIVRSKEKIKVRMQVELASEHPDTFKAVIL